MKTPKILLILLTAILITACSKETPNENSDISSNQEETMKAETLPAPGNLISLEKAKEQLDNYNEAHPQELGTEYALRTWISIKELKAYIEYVEEEAKQKGITVNGIDIIHTQHKKAAAGSPNPNNSVYEKSLMLAPTYKNGNSNVAFDPIYSEEGKPKDLKILLEEMTSNTGPEAKSERMMKSSIANNMQSCPNNCH